jgi:hypothetical protein
VPKVQQKQSFYQQILCASGGNTYTGEATATLNEGEFVPATGLKLVKQP